MGDVVRMESQYGDVRLRITCQHLSSNTCRRVDHSGDLVALGSLDDVRVRDDDTTKSIREESGAVRKTRLNPEHAATQAIEECRCRVHPTLSGARDGRCRCTLYDGIIVRQRDRRSAAGPNSQVYLPPIALPVE